MKTLLWMLRLALILAVCGLASDYLLGWNRRLAIFGCLGFILLYAVLAHLLGSESFGGLWPPLSPQEPLPHGGRLHSLGREALLYRAADGREMPLECFGGRDSGYTIYIGPRWGFNNGPALSEEERQQILADVTEYHRRLKVAFQIKDNEENILADMPQPPASEMQRNRQWGCLVALSPTLGAMALGAGAAELLLDDYHLIGALGLGIIGFLAPLYWRARDLPSGASMHHEGREGLLYRAADGRILAMGRYWDPDRNRDEVHLGNRWGFNDGPAISDAEREVILNDIAEYYRRHRKAYIVLMNEKRVEGQGAANPLP
jgi:hypothetical protein